MIVDTIKQLTGNWFTRVFLLSLVVHLLALVTVAFVVGRGFFAAVLAPDAGEPPPRPMAFELVETPADAEPPDPEEKTNYVSDRSARARNVESPDALPLGESYSAGVVPSPQLQERPGRPAAANQPPPERADLGEEEARAPARQSRFTRDMLTQSAETEVSSEEGGGELKRPQGENRETRAPDLGSFSLNTYAWDFAPYMLRLKRRIEGNIFPPPAFTYMGMISGKTFLKFRIAPDGKMALLEVLEYNGHKSLMTTSVRAVDVSAPFEPLPAAFPEDFLEITARFEYFIKR